MIRIQLFIHTSKTTGKTHLYLISTGHFRRKQERVGWQWHSTKMFNILRTRMVREIISSSERKWSRKVKHTNTNRVRKVIEWLNLSILLQTTLVTNLVVLVWYNFFTHFICCRPRHRLVAHTCTVLHPGAEETPVAIISAVLEELECRSALAQPAVGRAAAALRIRIRT